MRISRRGFIGAAISLGTLIAATSRGSISFSKKDSRKQLLSDRFYGGTDNVRKILADSLKEAREEKGVSQEDLDKDCMLGYTGSVKCREYESDYRCITPITFSLVSSHLV